MPLIQELPIFFVSLYGTRFKKQNQHKHLIVSIKILNVYNPIIQLLPFWQEPKEPAHRAAAILQGHLLWQVEIV